MTEIEMTQEVDYLELSADIVAAYVSNNSLPPTEIGKFLVGVHAAIKGLAEGGSAASEEDKVVKATPAQIKKSMTPDALISFEDGKSYKTMRRHLTLRGLTPEGYRAKYGLPADYPMVAASYSAARSALARSFGLGQTRKGSGKAAQAEAEATGGETQAVAKPKRAGRPRKAIAAE
ncbi:MAG: MucR family transcriptional regulator [Methylobacterium sp.]|uniref:MucR family transcriptional regulator n=1 Tax=Methylobacterium sp. TaxID=409 RepID=UPI00271D10FD|nr:MucR family transcriptional regulator [Methylobacterium sp.]MDO9427350.1 MucR family transcriptional regulator [Methylobacterium sp.]